MTSILGEIQPVIQDLVTSVTVQDEGAAKKEKQGIVMLVFFLSGRISLMTDDI